MKGDPYLLTIAYPTRIIIYFAMIRNKSSSSSLDVYFALTQGNILYFLQFEFHWNRWNDQQAVAYMKFEITIENSEVGKFCCH